MAYTNLSALSDVAQLQINTSGLNSSTEVVNQVMQSAINAGVNNYWFNLSVFVLFCFLIWFLYRPENKISLDLTRAVLKSSAWCLFISIAILLSGWIDTILPLYWYGTIWFIAVIGVLSLKPKGL